MRIRNWKLEIGILAVVCCAVFLTSIGFGWSGKDIAYAQQDCYEDGTFGPTCAATLAPTAAPTVPGATSTPPELPQSGNTTTTLAILLPGAGLLLFGYYRFAPQKIS